MEILLLFTIRKQRTKSRQLAIAETLALLNDLKPDVLPGGPKGDMPGVFWMTLDEQHMAEAILRFPRLGLSYIVETLEPIPESQWRRNTPTLVRWRGEPFKIVRLYQESAEFMVRHSPNERTFYLDAPEGIRKVKGYRGPRGKRALQAYDAQLLLNLLGYAEDSFVLDPFAGAGNIIEAGQRFGYSTFSIDIDPVLRYGLKGTHR